VTIREQVKEVLGVINTRFKELDAGECAEFAQKLAALLPIVLENEAEAEGTCNMYMSALMEGDDKMTAAKARIKMQATEEWLEWKKIVALRKGMEETIKTLKKNVEAKTYEYQTS